jgi:hypothetical protein
MVDVTVTGNPADTFGTHNSRMSPSGANLGVDVLEEPDLLPYDAMVRAGAHLIVGEIAHLRWRVWLHDVRRQAREDAVRIVREQLGHLVADDDTPLFTATIRDRRP